MWFGNGSVLNGKSLVVSVLGLMHCLFFSCGTRRPAKRNNKKQERGGKETEVQVSVSVSSSQGQDACGLGEGLRLHLD